MPDTPPPPNSTTASELRSIAASEPTDQRERAIAAAAARLNWAEADRAAARAEVERLRVDNRSLRQRLAMYEDDLGLDSAHPDTEEPEMPMRKPITLTPQQTRALRFVLAEMLDGVPTITMQVKVPTQSQNPRPVLVVTSPTTNQEWELTSRTRIGHPHA